MPHANTDWTVEMVHALPEDGLRYEVIDGELFVTPAPTWTHQRVVLELALKLNPYIVATGCGALTIAPAAVQLGPRTEVQPDLFVTPLVGKRPARSWEETGSMLLAIEVLSPSSSRADRDVKRQLYLRMPVGEYWLMDAERRLVTRWRPGSPLGEELRSQLEWQPAPTHPALTIDLRAFFASVHGEQS